MSVCIVETNETSIRDKEIKGEYPTDLKTHLRICYNKYKCFEAAEAERMQEKEKIKHPIATMKLKQSTTFLQVECSPKLDLYAYYILMYFHYSFLLENLVVMKQEIQQSFQGHDKLPNLWL